MILRYVLGATLLFMYCSAARGQGVYALTQGGWAPGNGNGGIVGQLAGGIQHKGWSWGVAAGVDNSLTTTLPILADVRRTLVKGKTSLVLFSQQGWNVASRKTTGKTAFPNDERIYGGGAYWMGGFTWKIADGFLISAGTVFKQFKQETIWPAGPDQLGMPQLEYDVHNVEKTWRGILMVGWEW